jgi:hypothetical protein
VLGGVVGLGGAGFKEVEGGGDGLVHPQAEAFLGELVKGVEGVGVGGLFQEREEGGEGDAQRGRGPGEAEVGGVEGVEDGVGGG